MSDDDRGVPWAAFDPLGKQGGYNSPDGRQDGVPIEARADLDTEASIRAAVTEISRNLIRSFAAASHSAGLVK
jgi:hypothetical protein